MHLHLRSTLTRLTLGAAVASLVVLASAAPAEAHRAPTPGTTCATSGAVKVAHRHVSVCLPPKPGATPRWGTSLPASRSPLRLADGWAKAADSGMSAAFGTVTNPSRRTLRIVGAFSPYAKVVQLHEVIDKDGAMVMQQRTGGFVIRSGGTLELKPGGNHLMFLGITRPIKAGTLVPLTLVTSDGGLLRLTVLGKVFNGANEDYPSGSTGMSGM